MILNKKKYRVTFLIEKNNDWFSSYLKTFWKRNKKYFFKVSSNIKNVSNQDIVFILNNTKIISKKNLLKNKLNLVLHSSDLPKDKGGAPLHWQVLRGKNKLSLCLFEAKEKLDSGNIYTKERLVFNGSELYDEMREKQAQKMILIINKFLTKYPNVKSYKQKGKSTFNRLRNTRDSELKIFKTIKDQFNLMRITDNSKYPLFFKYKKNKYILKIFKAD